MKTIYMIFAGIFFSSCQMKNESEVQKFEGGTPQKDEIVAHKTFSFAQKEKIPYKIIKKYISNAFGEDDPRKISTSEYQRNGYFLDIEFQNITQEQYQKLMNRFGGKNIVSYQKDKKYTLLDFLPPFVQATSGLRLIPHLQDVPLAENILSQLPLRGKKTLTVESSMNCWDTVIAFLKSQRDPWQNNMKIDISHMFRQKAREILTEPLFQTLNSQEEERNQGRNVGDILYFKDPIYGIAHVATWIDDDIYFEKPNAFASDLFRLAFWEDIRKSYSRSDFHFLRLKNPAGLKSNIHFISEPMPPPLDSLKKEELGLSADFLKRLVFGMDSGKMMAALVTEVPLEIHKSTLRAQISPQGFEDNTFRLAQGQSQGSSLNPPIIGKLVAIAEPFTWVKKSMQQSSALSDSEKCKMTTGSALFYKNLEKINENYYKMTQDSASGICPHFKIGDTLYLYKSHFTFTKR